MKKALIGGGILVALIILIVVGSVRGGDDAKSVDVADISTQTIQSTVLASGSLVYREEVKLRPEVMGKVSDVPIEEGDKVSKDQVVVRIDPETFKAQAASQKANEKMAEIAIEQQKLRIKKLKNDWRRKKQLDAKGLIDKATFENAINALAIARAELASRKQALSLSRAQYAKAHEQLNRTTIRSPINGVITHVDVKPGETVIAGTMNIVGSPVMTIADPSAMYAEVRVDEADIGHIALGQTVDVTAVAYPNDSVRGKIRFIATSATKAPGHQGLSFKVKILLDNSQQIDLRPGMSCRAEIHTRASKGTLAAPTQAVMYTRSDRENASAGKASGYVFVLVNGEVKKREVQTGLSNDQWVAIDSGLNAGDTVVTGPYELLHHLKAGDPVKATEKNQT